MENYNKKEFWSLNENNEKIFIKKMFKVFCRFSFILEFFVSILFNALIFKLCNYKYSNHISKVTIIFGAVTFILLCFFIFFNIKKNKRVENLFLSFMVPIGIMYATFVLVDKVPDEQVHIYRAYNISIFNIIGDTKFQEESVPLKMKSLENITNYYEEYQELDKKADYDLQCEKDFNVCMTYPPLVYVMPSITFFICRMLNVNILIAVYLARISNLILFLFTGWWCLKKIPFGKTLMLVYLFMPMIIHQAASVSADAFINCISLAFITYILYLRFEDVKFDKKHKIIFTILAIGLALTKHIYFPIAFIALILLFDKKINKKDKFFIVFILILVSIVAISWFLFSNVYKDVRGYILENEISLTNQLKYIVHDPIKFTNVIGNTIFNKAGIYLAQFIGKDLGLLVIGLNSLVIILYFILMLLTPLFESSNHELNLKEKITFIVIAIGIYLLVLVGLYLTWTTVGKDMIDGVQGRYFIPIAILPLLCLIKKENKKEIKNINLYVTLSVVIVNLYAIYKVIAFFI